MGRLECVTFQLPERKESGGGVKVDLDEEVVTFDGGRKLSRWGVGVEGSCDDMARLRPDVFLNQFSRCTGRRCQVYLWNNDLPEHGIDGVLSQD